MRARKFQFNNLFKPKEVMGVQEGRLETQGKERSKKTRKEKGVNNER